MKILSSRTITIGMNWEELRINCLQDPMKFGLKKMVFWFHALVLMPPSKLISQVEYSKYGARKLIR